MTYFTVLAVVQGAGLKPCAIVDAVSAEAAVADARRMRRRGDLAFVAAGSRLIARRAVERELKLFREYLSVRGERGAVDFAFGRDRDRALAFFHQFYIGVFRRKADVTNPTVAADEQRAAAAEEVHELFKVDWEKGGDVGGQ